MVQLVKNPPGNAGDLGSIPGLGRSPGEEKGYPLQKSGLENSIVHGVAKSQTQLNDFHSLTHNVVTVSTVQQNESVIHIHIPSLLDFLPFHVTTAH